MSFEDIDIKPVYTTGRNDLLKEFYIPVISNAINYDRAAGYFSSHIFSKIAVGLSAFFSSNQGNMRLIFGGEIAEDDANAINDNKSYETLLAHTEEILEDAINRMVSEIDKKRLDLLSLLIKTGRLEMKFVYKKKGMFHDKFGLFYDSDSNAVLFQGSSNETESGFIHNVESITCFKTNSYVQQEHIAHFKDLFESVWNGKEKGCLVLDIPVAIKEKLLNIRIRNELISPEDEIELEHEELRSATEITEYKDSANVPTFPEYYKGHKYSIRDHQKAALEIWQTNNYFGIAELCTGAGKTVMAIHSIVKLYNARSKLFVVISAPYINLAEQWIEELKLFNINPIACYSGNNYRDNLSNAISRFNLGSISFCCVVVVNATLKNNDFLESLHSLDNIFYIADECHHLRNIVKNKKFKISAQYKLGLSATPLHYYDEAGNKELCNFFGCKEPFYKYTLKNALEDNVLTNYNYFPIPIKLTADESETYRILTKEIGRLMQSEFDENTYLDNLIRKRTELIATAENKLLTLKDLPVIKTKSPLTLFYCGIDSLNPTNDDGMRQIDKLSQILSDNKWNTTQYTSKENTNTRKMILNSFRNGSIDAMIAMRCLDEGVDIPGCYNAFILASSRDPRQFIQRRGRVLRKAPGKEFANIYDFIVIPPNIGAEVEAHDIKLTQNEFERALEFANLALNSIDAKMILLPFAKEFGLTHLL